MFLTAAGGSSGKAHEAWFRDLAARCPGTADAHLPLVMWSDSIHGGNERMVNHHNDFFSLYIVQRGRGTHIIDGVSYGIARGDVYAMGIGMRHHFAGCEDLVLHTLHFAPGIFDAATLDALAQTHGFHSLFVDEPLTRRRTGKAGAGCT